jgi:hypothetical protein
MQQIDEVGNFRVETQTHRRFVNNFAGVVANHRNAQNFLDVAVGNHFDHACGVADRAPRAAQATWERHCTSNGDPRPSLLPR